MVTFLVLLGGCKVVVAPDTLQELAVFGFVNYEDERSAQATSEAYPPLVDDNAADLEAGLYVDMLSSADLAAVGLDGSAVDILGAMGSVAYTHGLDDVLAITTAPNKEDFFDDTPVYDVEEGAEDRDCFLSRECDHLDQVVTDSIEVPLLGTATRTYQISWTWVDGPGGPMVLSRTLNPDGITLTSDIMQVFQQYALVCSWEEDGRARRVEAFWVDAEFIGIDVPKSFAVDSAVDQMRTSAEMVDEAIDAGWP